MVADNEQWFSITTLDDVCRGFEVELEIHTNKYRHRRISHGETEWKRGKPPAEDQNLTS